MARYRNSLETEMTAYPKLMEEYEIMGEIGKGSQATVYLCRNRRSKKKVACKTFYKISEGMLEEQILRKLSGCPGVVHLEEVIHEDVGDYCHLIMELCELSLDHFIRTNGKLPPNEAALLIANLAQTVQHMHDHGVIHRDLKPANILVPSPSAPYHVRVADFGLSASFSDPAPRFTETVGTPIYFAPEVVRKSDSTEINLWDLGLVLYESLTGLPVFPRLNIWGIYQELLDGVDLAASYYLDWPDDVVCEEAKDLVLAMLKPKAEDRITLYTQQILSNPWIIKHNLNSVEKRASYKIKIRLPAAEPQKKAKDENLNRGAFVQQNLSNNLNAVEKRHIHKIKIRLPAAEPQKKQDRAEDEILERGTFVLPPKKRIKFQQMSNDILQAAQPFVLAYDWLLCK